MTPRPRPRASAILTLLVLSACGGEGREVVTGFHGYAWGTEPSEIPEIQGSAPVGEKDELVIYSATVSHLGRETLAGFYFHPRTLGLVEGYYVLPITLEECEVEWRRYAGDLERAFPGLRREEHVPVRPAADSARYVSDCEYFVYHSETVDWSVTFENPEGPGDSAGLRLATVGRSLRLTIFYQGGEGERWESRFRWPAWLRPTPEPPAPERQRPGSEGLPLGRA